MCCAMVAGDLLLCRRLRGGQKVCEQLPSFESALADGAVSSRASQRVGERHRRNLPRSRRKPSSSPTKPNCSTKPAARRSNNSNNPASARARSATADDAASELERQRRANRIKHWIDNTTGMGHIHSELDPESHAKVLAAIYARLRTLRQEQRSSRTNSDDPDDPTGPPDELRPARSPSVHRPRHRLDHPRPTDPRGDRARRLGHPAQRAARPVTVRNLRRHPTPTGHRAPAVLPSQHHPRRARRRQPATRPRSCQAPRLTRPTRSDPHDAPHLRIPGVHGQCRVLRETDHTEEWLADNGPTDLDKLVPLCCKHHHLVHEVAGP